MKRIGTISLNINAPDFNYGAILHSWAIQQYLLKNYDVQTEIIDYTTPKIEGWNRYDPAKSSLNYLESRSFTGNHSHYLSRAKKFDAFIKDHLIVSEKKYTQKTIANADLPYDTVICESDVIWSPKREKLDPVFFLATKCMQGKRRIAYAPSMADADLTKEQDEQLDLLLHNLHFISCRESFMQNVLKGHTDKPIKHLVDPVMLLDADDYNCITAPRLLKEDYLLLYLPVDNNQKLRNSAIDYANRHGLKILEISTKLKDNMSSIETCIPDAGIEEFLSAIKYADTVFTNSFHAICFSIIFQKQFYAFTRKFNGKVVDVCQFFDLQDYYMTNDEFIEQERINYTNVYQTFLQLQQEGRDWLDHALTAHIEDDDTNFDYHAIEKCFDNTSFPYQIMRVVQKCYRKAKKIVRNCLKKIIKKTGRIAGKFIGKGKSFFNRLLKAADDNRRDRLSSRYRDSVAIVPGKIAVMTITDSFNCNPKYICLELLRRNPNREIVWLVGKDTDLTVFPKNIRTVDKDSIQAIKEVYSSELLLDNGICFSERFERKDGQKHFQTMHGSLGIKKLDNSIPSRMRTIHGRKVVHRECDNTDCIFTNSQFEEDVFSTVFWKNVPMLRFGHARTDVLFETKTEVITPIRQKLLQDYGIPLDKKIVLFAPTHRKGLTMKDLAIDYPELVSTLHDRFGSDYVVLLRLHNKTKAILLDNIRWTDELKKVLFDVTDYPDIQELMLVTEIGITDYSSWIYDFVNTHRPGFIFATDLEKYNNITGLYYPLEETPFPVCKSNRELLYKVKHFDADLYQRRVTDFLTEKQAIDDGHSAERIADKIEQSLQK